MADLLEKDVTHIKDRSLTSIAQLAEHYTIGIGDIQNYSHFDKGKKNPYASSYDRTVHQGNEIYIQIDSATTRQVA